MHYGLALAYVQRIEDAVSAEIYAQPGETEKTLEWLEHAVSIGFINYPFLNEYDPFLGSIRGEERFKKLMQGVKYEWKHFDA